MTAQFVPDGAEDTTETKPCRLHDLDNSKFSPQICLNGFERIDLLKVDGLPELLAEINGERLLSEEHAKGLIHKLSRASFPLGNGYRLRLVFVAKEGLFMRTQAPNKVSFKEQVEMNGT